MDMPAARGTNTKGSDGHADCSMNACYTQQRTESSTLAVAAAAVEGKPAHQLHPTESQPLERVYVTPVGMHVPVCIHRMKPAPPRPQSLLAEW